MLGICSGTHQIFEFIYLYLYKLLCELCLFCSANASAAIVFTNINFIHILNGTNFKDWKENVLIVLGYMDLDFAIRIEQPPPLTMDSSIEAKSEFKRWDCSNRMSLVIIKCSISETLRGKVSREFTTAKEFLDDIENHFVKNNKAKTSTLLGSLVSVKYQGQGNIREYIMHMSNISSKLKALKLELSDDLLVHLVLLSLLAQFSQFKVSYNCQNDKLTLNEPISYCMKEKERLKQEKTESAHLESTYKDKNKKRTQDKEAASGPARKKHHKT